MKRRFLFAPVFYAVLAVSLMAPAALAKDRKPQYKVEYDKVENWTYIRTSSMALGKFATLSFSYFHDGKTPTRKGETLTIKFFTANRTRRWERLMADVKYGEEKLGLDMKGDADWISGKWYEDADSEISVEQFLAMAKAPVWEFSVQGQYAKLEGKDLQPVKDLADYIIKATPPPAP